ncbi:MAG: urease accessory UreF family protein [Candidatus Obscuribacterales bacterium]|nr:urease accessory UreF family protein [Candidatus Obscuribacterales bacterium]
MLSATEPLLALMQLSDSALPVGGYSHSWGLETWVQEGVIIDAVSTEKAINTLLTQSIATQDGIACGCANRLGATGQIESLSLLNQYLTASKWSKETCQASVRMGSRLLKLATETDFVTDLRGLTESPVADQTASLADLHHSVVFGWLAACAGVSEVAAISAYLQNSTGSLISACVRLIPLGHTDGQKIVVKLRPLIAQLTEQAAGRSIDGISSFAPLHEYASFAHESLYSRLFQS